MKARWSAQPFDPATARLSGAPSRLRPTFDFSSRRVWRTFRHRRSRNHRLPVARQPVARRVGGPRRPRVGVGRDGRRVHDGSHFAATTIRARQSHVSPTGAYDIWSLDFQRGSETRITLDDRITKVAGVLAPDEQTMSYGLARGGPPNLMRMDLRSGRSEPLLPRNPHLQQARGVSADSRLLAYAQRTIGGFHNLWTMPLDGSVPPLSPAAITSQRRGPPLCPRRAALHVHFK